MKATDNVSLRDIYDAVQDLRNEVGEKYVTKDEFLPVKSVTYGLVALILMAVATALVDNVIRAAI